MAANSIRSLQRDRYLDMMDSYYTFVSEYPESEYRKEVDRMQRAAKAYIEKHQTITETTETE